MHQREKVVRTIKGEEKVIDFVFGSGRLTGNPLEIQEVKGYKIMRGFGFSIRFDNGKNKKPTYYRLELWGNNAEHMARLGFEGQLIEVSGRVTVDSYNGKETNILTVERFTCLEYKDKVVNQTKDTPKSSQQDESQNEESASTQTKETVVSESDSSTTTPEPSERVKEVIPSGMEEVGQQQHVFDDIPF